MVNSTSSNPLPEDAEHSPKPIKSHESDSNPISPNSAARTADTDNGRVMAVLGYLLLPVSIINFLSPRPLLKFNGAQALVPLVVIFATFLALFIPIVGALVFLFDYIILMPLFAIASLYAAYKASQGQTFVFPIIGNWIMNQLHFKPDDLKA